MFIMSAVSLMRVVSVRMCRPTFAQSAGIRQHLVVVHLMLLVCILLMWYLLLASLLVYTRQEWRNAAPA